MAMVTYPDAGQRAVIEAMRADPSVWAVGEDLGRGGVFGQYRGLQDEFGTARISDTPISEACIMGAAVGAAMIGTRPIVEMRFSDFALCAIDELVNQAAKARYMFGGQMRVPVTVREPIGIWRSSAAQHSQSLEAWYAHIPGLVVMAPSTPADNHGLLQCHPLRRSGGLYGAQGSLGAGGGDAEGAGPPVRSRPIARAGDAVTVVTWSASVHACAGGRHPEWGASTSTCSTCAHSGRGTAIRSSPGSPAPDAWWSCMRRCGRWLRRGDRRHRRGAVPSPPQVPGAPPRRAPYPRRLRTRAGGSGAGDAPSCYAGTADGGGSGGAA